MSCDEKNNKRRKKRSKQSSEANSHASKSVEKHECCWSEVRNVVRCIYREAGTSLADEEETVRNSLDENRLKVKVEKLLKSDPAQLFEKLEIQAREYVREVKVRLVKYLTSCPLSPNHAKEFFTMLLDEYQALSKAFEILRPFFCKLDLEHLREHGLSWDLLHKHLFYTEIYRDPAVYGNLPGLITQLRLGAVSRENFQQDSFPNLLHRYLNFADDLIEIEFSWKESEQAFKLYKEKQARLREKSGIAKVEWEDEMSGAEWKNRLSKKITMDPTEAKRDNSLRHVNYNGYHNNLDGCAEIDDEENSLSDSNSDYDDDEDDEDDEDDVDDEDDDGSSCSPRRTSLSSDIDGLGPDVPPGSPSSVRSSGDGSSCDTPPVNQYTSSTEDSRTDRGKYCDCCYCEFFGHQPPPVGPTSHNYTEMRDRLRLRLNKRQPNQSVQENKKENAPVVDHRSVDDLLTFINGQGMEEERLRSYGTVCSNLLRSQPEKDPFW